MRRIIWGLLAILPATAPAGAEGNAIGFIGPLSGPFAVLGRQMSGGVAAAAGPGVIARDDACTAEGGRQAAEALVAEKVRIVVGFACTEAIDAALPALTPAGIPVITPAVRAIHLTDLRTKTGNLIFRIAPRADAEAAAAVRLLKPRWGDDSWAVLDDGSPANRALAESFRFAMEETGVKAALAAAFRPAQENQTGLAKRVRATGAVRVFVAGERADVATIAAALAGDGATTAVETASGEGLRDRPDGPALPDGVLMIAPPDWSSEADAAVLSAIRDSGVEPDGYAAVAYAAAQVALAVLDGGDNPATALSSTVFSTALGPVSFDGKGDWRESRFGLYVSAGQTFQPVSTP